MELFPRDWLGNNNLLELLLFLEGHFHIFLKLRVSVHPAPARFAFTIPAVNGNWKNSSDTTSLPQNDSSVPCPSEKTFYLEGTKENPDNDLLLRLQDKSNSVAVVDKETDVVKANHQIER